MMRNPGNLILKHTSYLPFVFIAIILFCGLQTLAQNESIAGEISTPYPTIINLAIEWKIQGDDNQNGIVRVRFREKGKTAWVEGMPLRRIPAGKNKTLDTLLQTVPGYPEFKWANKHS